MIDSTNSGARGVWPPRASGPPSTPAADIRAVVEEEAAHLGAADLDVPPLSRLDVRTADRAVVRIALLRFAATAYEDDEQVRARLHREIADLRTALLAYENDVVDEINAAVRDDRYELARLPTFEELRVRRRTYPEPRPMIQTAGWPDPIVPGSGGRRLSDLNEGAA